MSDHPPDVQAQELLAALEAIEEPLGLLIRTNNATGFSVQLDRDFVEMVQQVRRNTGPDTGRLRSMLETYCQSCGRWDRR